MLTFLKSLLFPKTSFFSLSSVERDLNLIWDLSNMILILFLLNF